MAPRRGSGSYRRGNYRHIRTGVGGVRACDSNASRWQWTSRHGWIDERRHGHHQQPDITVTSSNPTLLTADEAAKLARCSITTVRRAYTKGALVAYRRRGSRAVVFDDRDVVAWAQRDPLAPPAPSTPAPSAGAQERRSSKTRGFAVGRTLSPSQTPQPRVDISAAALGARRASMSGSGI